MSTSRKLQALDAMPRYPTRFQVSVRVTVAPPAVDV